MTFMDSIIRLTAETGEFIWSRQICPDEESWKEAGTEAVIGLEKFHSWRSFWIDIYSRVTLYCLGFV